MDLKELNDKVQEHWAQMKSHIDEQQAEIKKYEEARGETKQVIERYNTQLSKLEDEVKELRVSGSRPAYGRTDEGRTGFESKEAKQVHDLYFKALRLGIGN